MDALERFHGTRPKDAQPHALDAMLAFSRLDGPTVIVALLLLGVLPTVVVAARVPSCATDSFECFDVFPLAMKFLLAPLALDTGLLAVRQRMRPSWATGSAVVMGLVLLPLAAGVFFLYPHHGCLRFSSVGEALSPGGCISNEVAMGCAFVGVAFTGLVMGRVRSLIAGLVALAVLCAILSWRAWLERSTYGFLAVLAPAIGVAILVAVALFAWKARRTSTAGLR